MSHVLLVIPVTDMLLGHDRCPETSDALVFSMAAECLRSFHAVQVVLWPRTNPLDYATNNTPFPFVRRAATRAISPFSITTLSNIPPPTALPDFPTHATHVHSWLKSRIPPYSSCRIVLKCTALCVKHGPLTRQPRLASLMHQAHR